MSMTRVETEATVHQHWQLFLAEGIVLILLGVAALVVPPIASLTFELLVGWLLLISGIAGLVTTLSNRAVGGFGWSLFSALLALAAGAVLLWHPISGVFSLTLVLIAFFVLEGIASIMFALQHRRQLPGAWAWMVASGVVDLFLGAMIFLQLPSSATWAIGLLLGINLIFGGFALTAMAMSARPTASRTTA